MTSLWLGRARLRRDPAAAALAPILLPASSDARAGTAHRLVWSLFADTAERARDFLWREESPQDAGIGRTAFMTLSARPPEDRLGLFELDPPKLFEPLLAPGDRLAFALRANPVVTRKDPATGRSQRHDVVMDHLKAVPSGERGAARFAAMQEAGRHWLEATGARSGFRLTAAPRIDGYEQRRIWRDQAAKPVRFSVLDLEGTLEVTDPAGFLSALARGFGKAKAWGCGLMLIRRA